MPDAMKETTHTLIQTGKKIYMVDAVHPPSVHDMTNAYDSTGRAFQSDCKGSTISSKNI